MLQSVTWPELGFKIAPLTSLYYSVVAKHEVQVFAEAAGVVIYHSLCVSERFQ